jgi:5-methylcytosine-specific restriction endonuclease McrA
MKFIRCLVCNELKRVKPSETIRFCSPKCYALYLRLTGARAGKNNGNYGHHLSEDAKNRIRAARRALIQSRGYVISATGRKRLSKFFKGRIFTNQTRQRISDALKGDKHPNWAGGISKERVKIWRRRESKEWHKAVLTRDHFTCQNCGARIVPLHVHHKKSYALYPKLRTRLSNGLTLCIPCHRKTDSYGYTRAFRALQKVL